MTISISSPAANASVSGTVNVAGTVQDTVTVTGGGTQTLAAQSFSVPVDTTSLANGAQSLTASGGGATASVPVTVANTSAVSPSGTTIPPAAQIIDNATPTHGTWTVVAGKVYLNNALAGFTDQVNLLLYYNGVIWQRNVNNLWWPWNGTTWTGSGVGDPRPAGASPDGTTIPSASQIIDAGGSVWTMSGNTATMVPSGGTARTMSTVVVSILFFGGRVYVHNSATLNDGKWYQSQNDSAATANSTITWVQAPNSGADPRPSTPTLSVTSPANGFSSTSPVTVAGTTNQSSVVIKEGTTTLATLTPSGGAFSTTLALSAGSHTLVVSAGTATAVTVAGTVVANSATPAFNKVLVVLMENHGYSQIVGASAAPYINNTLIAGGALMTNYSAVAHPSQPNYLALYAGDTFGVADDNNIDLGSHPDLNTLLVAAGKTFKGFGESGNIERKHSPWESFPEGTGVETTWNNFNSTNPAQNVSWVSPAPLDNMHDGTIAQGDTWLSNNVNAYAQWAKANNSLLVVVFDEDDSSGNNRVACVLYGANIVPGQYNGAYNHYSLLKMILASQGITNAPANAAGATVMSGMFGSVAGPTLTVTAPLASFSSTSPVSFSGTTNQSSVVVKEGTTTLATVTPSGGSFSGTVVLAAGSHTLTFTAGTATAVTRTGTVTAGIASHFWGVNGHYVQGQFYTSTSFSQQKATLQDLGMKVTRQDAYTHADIDTMANTIVPGYSPVVVQPTFIFYPYDDTPNPTETTAYNYAFALAQYAATKLAGVVPIVEMGNEYDNASGPIGSDGESIANYDNAKFQIFRGALRGSIDGWRSVDTTGQTKIIANTSAGWLHFGFLDGLWNGKQPDGTTGHPTVRGDIVCWHWYDDMGDITQNVTGGSGTYNICDKIHTIVGAGVPIAITEIGARSSDSESTAQAYVTSQMANIAAAASAKNIIMALWYETYDTSGDPGYGLLSSSTTQKPRYATMKSVIAAHPMP